MYLQNLHFFYKERRKANCNWSIVQPAALFSNRRNAKFRQVKSLTPVQVIAVLNELKG